MGAVRHRRHVTVGAACPRRPRAGAAAGANPRRVRGVLGVGGKGGGFAVKGRCRGATRPPAFALPASTSHRPNLPPPPLQPRTPARTTFTLPDWAPDCPAWSARACPPSLGRRACGGTTLAALAAAWSSAPMTPCLAATPACAPRALAQGACPHPACPQARAGTLCARRAYPALRPKTSGVAPAGRRGRTRTSCPQVRAGRALAAAAPACLGEGAESDGLCGRHGTPRRRPPPAPPRLSCVVTRRAAPQTTRAGPQLARTRAARSSSAPSRHAADTRPPSNTTPSAASRARFLRVSGVSP